MSLNISSVTRHIKFFEDLKKSSNSPKANLQQPTEKHTQPLSKEKIFKQHVLPFYMAVIETKKQFIKMGDLIQQSHILLPLILAKTSLKKNKTLFRKIRRTLSISRSNKCPSLSSSTQYLNALKKFPKNIVNKVAGFMGTLAKQMDQKNNRFSVSSEKSKKWLAERQKKLTDQSSTTTKESTKSLFKKTVLNFLGKYCTITNAFISFQQSDLKKIRSKIGEKKIKKIRSKSSVQIKIQKGKPSASTQKIWAAPKSSQVQLQQLTTISPNRLLESLRLSFKETIKRANSLTKVGLQLKKTYPIQAPQWISSATSLSSILLSVDKQVDAMLMGMNNILNGSPNQ